jgi:hypothetical protein
MPKPPKPSRTRRSGKPDRRRALELLAASRDGVTEAVMLAHGFTIPQMLKLVRDGLASATAERMRAGKHEMEIARVRIATKGRKALADSIEAGRRRHARLSNSSSDRPQE